MLMEKVCQLLPHVSQSKVSVKKCASNTEKIVDKRQKDFREKKSPQFQINEARRLLRCYISVVLLATSANRSGELFLKAM